MKLPKKKQNETWTAKSDSKNNKSTSPKQKALLED